MSAAERRTYVVGLPVVFTIDPDGFVTAVVDTGDLTKALGEHSDYPDGVVRLDAMLLRAWEQQYSVSNEGHVR